jgi:hypothetical protein
MPITPKTGSLFHAGSHSAEQFHFQRWLNNATRLSRIDWLWSAKRACVWVTGGSGRGINQENPTMRIYIIGNDGIALCRQAPATVTESEIAVASNEELHAAPLSGKRLLALWNALLGAEKRRKVGDRAALIDHLWSAVEALPAPEPQSDAKRPSKQEEVIASEAEVAGKKRRHRPRDKRVIFRGDSDRYIVFLGDDRIGFVRRADNGTWNHVDHQLGSDPARGRSTGAALPGEPQSRKSVCAMQ